MISINNKSQKALFLRLIDFIYLFSKYRTKLMDSMDMWIITFIYRYTLLIINTIYNKHAL